MISCLRIIKKIHHPGLEQIYIDNWEVNESLFEKRLQEILRRRKVLNIRAVLESVELIAEHQADEKYTVVGAASILSKTASDRQYDRYRKRFGDFGSGSPGDPKTRMFVWRHRHNPVPIIRQSWRTFKHLSQLEKIEDDSIYGAQMVTSAIEPA